MPVIANINLRSSKRVIEGVVNHLIKKPDCELEDKNLEGILANIRSIPSPTSDINIHVMVLNLVYRLMQVKSLNKDTKAGLKAITDTIYESYGSQAVFETSLESINEQPEDQCTKDDFGTSSSSDRRTSSNSGAFNFIVGFVCGGSANTSMSTIYLNHTSGDFAAGYAVGLFSNAVTSSSTNSSDTSNSKNTSNSSGTSSSSSTSNSSGPSNSSGGGLGGLGS
jgi:hypothetical protein